MLHCIFLFFSLPYPSELPTFEGSWMLLAICHCNLLKKISFQYVNPFKRYWAETVVADRRTDRQTDRFKTFHWKILTNFHNFFTKEILVWPWLWQLWQTKKFTGRQAGTGVISVLLIGLYNFVMFTISCLNKWHKQQNSYLEWQYFQSAWCL